MAETKLDRLKANLKTSDTASKDQSLFQVIDQLINYLVTNTVTLDEVVEIVNPSGGGGSVLDKTYLTESDETDVLPDSRMIVAGQRITFDDSVPGIRTENVPINEVVITGANEAATLPNSRRLLAGTNITFDDTVANERTLNVDAITADEIRDLGYWSPLVNVVGDGDVEMVVTDGGQPIAVWTRTP